MSINHTDNLIGQARKHLQSGKYTEAIQHYAWALEKDAACLYCWLEMGVAYQAMGQLSSAISACRQALKIAPNHPLAHGNLGSFLQQSGDLEGAEVAYRRAVEIDSSFVDAIYNLGYLHAAQRKRDEAIAYFERALELQPGREDATIGLAAMLERQGKIEQAYGYLQPLIKTNRGTHFALINFAQVCTSLGRGDEAIAPLEDRVRRNDLPSENLLQLHFALGKLYDKQEQYPQAFAHYRRGNDLKPAVFDTASYQKKMAAITQSYCPAFMKSLPRASNHSRRPVFIMAMPRSGTSLVEQILSSHPAVYGAGETEDISTVAMQLHPLIQNRSITETQLDEVASRYLDNLESVSADARRVVDKTVNSYVNIGLIRLLFPEALIIHCRRNPLDTCLSCYFANLGDSHPYSYSLDNLVEFYREYRRIMAHWQTVPEIQVLDIHYEDLVHDLEAGARSMIEFIGLDWDPRCLDFHTLERQVTTISYDHQVRRPVYTSSVNRWEHYREFLGPQINRLAGKNESNE